MTGSPHHPPIAILVCVALSLEACVLTKSLDERDMDSMDASASLDLTTSPDFTAPQDLSEPADLAPPADVPGDSPDALLTTRPVASLTIYTMASRGLSVSVNAPLQLLVAPRDAEGNETTCSPTWDLLDTRQGMLSEDGLLTPLNTGPIDVIASCDDVRAQVVVDSTLPTLGSPDLELMTWLVADRGIERDRDVVNAWQNAHLDTAVFTPPRQEARPLFLERVPEINDFPALDFTADYLTQDPTTLFEDTLSIITVVRGTTEGSTNYIAGYCNTPSRPEFGNHSLAFDQDGNYELNSKATVEGNGINDRSEYFMSTSPSIWHVRTLIIGENNVSLHEDGELIKEQPPVSAPLRFRMQHLGGWCSSSGNRFSGQMAEILIFQGDLGVLDREALEFYLMQKYKL